MLDPRYTWMRQLTAFALLLAVWETAGRADMINPMYAPNPSRVGAALVDLFSDGRIWPHLEATFTAALGGLALGIVVGTVLGVVAALVRLIAELIEPVMTVLNAIPRVILAPLFVIWLGIGLASKVALSFILVAVLIFFTVFTGIRQVDRRLVERVVTLGGKDFYLGVYDSQESHAEYRRLVAEWLEKHRVASPARDVPPTVPDRCSRAAS
jgi:NitT/TauT family transport system permease protein